LFIGRVLKKKIFFFLSTGGGGEGIIGFMSIKKKTYAFRYDFIPKMKKKKKKNDNGCSSLIQSTRNPHYYKVLLILCPVWPTQQFH